ncbi:MAG: hypothetical protein PHC62_07255 [Candidatus Izemoplasmatales bacterium]|nr:hypothetical protein [Candidatus Izemoplasmatales bacterium]
MKRIMVYIVFLILSLIFALSKVDYSNLYGMIIIPLVLIGDGIRWLSLASPLLNSVAIFLFILLGIIPLYVGASMFIRKKITLIDYISLPIITVVWFVTLYFFINPGLLIHSLNELIQANLSSEVLELSITILLSGMSYILLLTVLIYLVLKFALSKKYKTVVIFKTLVDFVIIGLIIVTVGIQLKSLINVFSTANQNGYEQFLSVTKFIFAIITYGATGFLLYLFRELIIDLDENNRSENGIKLCYKIYIFSLSLIVFTLFSQLFLNVFQMIFLHEISDVSLTLNIPIFSLIISVVALLVTRFLTRMHELRSDHELII